MEGSGARTGLALSWLWIAAVVVYMVWGAVAHAGLYRWLVDLQIARTGAYYEEATAAVPILLLAAPALAYIRRYTQKREALLDQGSAAQARRGRGVARAVVLIGVLCLLVAGGAYMLAQGVPDGSEPATAIDALALGSGPVPQGKVMVRGAVVPEATTGVSETSRYIDRNILYVAFRVEGAASGPPHRLFVERYMGDSSGAAVTQGFFPEQDGYLIENGLPPPALADLAARGIKVASPHYVLRPGDDTRRTPYYVVAALGVLIGSICLLVGLIAFLRAGARAAQ